MSIHDDFRKHYFDHLAKNFDLGSYSWTRKDPNYMLTLEDITFLNYFINVERYTYFTKRFTK